jgi:hypothetical protein
MPLTTHPQFHNLELCESGLTTLGADFGRRRTPKFELNPKNLFHAQPVQRRHDAG